MPQGNQAKMDNSPEPANHFDKLSLELKWHILDFVNDADATRTAKTLRLVNRKNAMNYIQPVAKSTKLVVMLNQFGLRQLEYFANSDWAPHIRHVEVVNTYLWNISLGLVESGSEEEPGKRKDLDNDDDDLDYDDDIGIRGSEQHKWSMSKFLWKKARSTVLPDITLKDKIRTDHMNLLRLQELDGETKTKALEEEDVNSQTYDQAAKLLNHFPGVRHVSTGIVTKIMATLGTTDGEAETELPPIYADADLNRLYESFGTISHTSSTAHLGHLVDRLTFAPNSFGAQVHTLDVKYCRLKQEDPIPSLASVCNILSLFRNVRTLTIKLDLI